MIADHETNVVFVADTLERRFPAVYGGLKTILERHGIPLRTIPGTREIWCRDYLPIQVSVDRFIQFQYSPDYLTGKYRYLRADGQIGPILPFTRNCERSEIVLDGGNVVRWSDKVIVCDKLLSENAGWRPAKLLRALGELFCVDQVIVIPTEPGDVVGHADGAVRFIDGGLALMNNYSIANGRYGAALKRVMIKAGLDVIELPYRPWTGRSRGIPPATGCYINYLQAGGLFVLPSFDFPEDQEALDCVQRSFQGSDVQTLECTDLSAEGGALNCATWTMLKPKRVEQEQPYRASHLSGEYPPND